MNSHPDFHAWVLGLLLLVPAALPAVELEQLFLPSSYLRHLHRIYDAARLVEQSERCQRFIKGELHLDRSTLEHPVFRFTCRDDREQLYSLLVDGLSLEMLDDTRPEGSVSFEQHQRELDEARERERQQQLRLEKTREALRQEQERLLEERQLMWEEQERQRLQELQERLEQQRRALLWQLCREHLARDVRNMIDVEWLTTTMPEPIVEEEDWLRFDIDFDARDLSGQHLRYRAQCRGLNREDYSLRIRPRALVEAAERGDSEENQESMGSEQGVDRE